MRAYAEITTQEEMDALLSRVGGFHDSMAKELHLVNRGWVDPDRSMTMTHGFDARLLIQTQWPPFAIELLFIGIEQLQAQPPGEFWGASGSVTLVEAPVEKRLVTIRFDDELAISAARLFVLDRSDWLGPRARFGVEVPHPDCVAANPMEDGWRQCSLCAEAFQESADVIYVLCPGCGTLTECF
ncbi:MAG TPA: hypothetical protein VFR31_13880 [Thermoanaerobaculia bacterium]|nr:hypothetical protein [Thermoanaerobaculia bacterium]